MAGENLNADRANFGARTDGKFQEEWLAGKLDAVETLLDMGAVEKAREAFWQVDWTRVSHTRLSARARDIMVRITTENLR